MKKKNIKAKAKLNSKSQRKLIKPPKKKVAKIVSKTRSKRVAKKSSAALKQPKAVNRTEISVVQDVSKRSKLQVGLQPKPPISQHTSAGSDTAVPSRPPMRKIIGRDSTIQSAEIIQLKPTGNSAASRPEKLESSQAQAFTIQEEVLVLQPKVMWETLPYTVPAALSFIVGSAKRECEKAAASLFSFGKFMAALPRELCGLELAFLIMRLEHESDEIARICDLEAAKLSAHLNRASDVIENTFAAHCPDISRKFHSQIKTGRKVAAALIEPVLIAEVDRNWQILLSELILLTVKHQALERNSVIASAIRATTH